MNKEYKDGDIYTLDLIPEIIESVRCLQLGEQAFFNEADYGHGFIIHGDNCWECWSIPMYGGEEILEQTVNTAKEAVETLASWT